MSDPISLLTEVWNLGSIGFSLVAGALVGYFAVGRYASDPAYASMESSPFEYGVLTSILAIAVGAVFFGFQIIATYIDGDPGWTRVVSRFCIWVVYALAIGAGTHARVGLYMRGKHLEAKRRALTELDRR